jgi:hypothetical protein
LPQPKKLLDFYTFHSENFLLRFLKYPLPSREGMKGRGMIFGSTPTLALPHQEGEENILKKFQISLVNFWPLA